jgi:hypothetical protein
MDLHGLMALTDRVEELVGADEADAFRTLVLECQGARKAMELCPIAPSALAGLARWAETHPDVTLRCRVYEWGLAVNVAHGGHDIPLNLGGEYGQDAEKGLDDSLRVLRRMAEAYAENPSLARSLSSDNASEDPWDSNAATPLEDLRSVMEMGRTARRSPLRMPSHEETEEAIAAWHRENGSRPLNMEPFYIRYRIHADGVTATSECGRYTARLTPEGRWRPDS